MPGAAAATRLRARALYCASVLNDTQGDLARAEALGREACDIYRQFDDIKGVATTMTVIGYQAQRQGRPEEAVSLFGETASLWAQLGDVTAVDLATSNMAHRREDPGRLRPLPPAARTGGRVIAGAGRRARRRVRVERARRRRGVAGRSRVGPPLPPREPREVSGHRRSVGRGQGPGGSGERRSPGGGIRGGRRLAPRGDPGVPRPGPSARRRAPAGAVVLVRQPAVTR